jgi:quinol monooxygenase YgiN
MDLAVLTRRRALPGQATALVRALLTRLETAQDPQWQRARVFQDLEVPERVTVLSDWASIEAYEARAQLWNTPVLDRLCESGPRRRLYHRVEYFAQPGRPAHLLSFARYLFPAEQRPAMLRLVRDVMVPTLRAQPGLIRQGLYVSLDDDRRMFMLLGWESRTAWEHGVQALAERAHEQAQAIGLQTRRAIWRRQADLVRE